MSASLSQCMAIVKKVVDPSSRAPIIALYYAASWCPDCVASKPYVSEAFKIQQKNGGEKLFDLVYVSSDNDSNQMKGEMEDGWDAIDFENEDARSSLKKCFGVCAFKEMEALGISREQRKGGIPTLVLIDKQTSGVLSSDGMPDIMGEKKLDDPLARWRSLLP
eukprot:jgi/Psemu1/234398/estExt_Genewise1.C_150078